MTVKQLSVFVENRTGTMVEIIQVLGECGIDIRALSIADTTDFGILRLIVSDPERALSALKERNITVSITEVIGVKLVDRPGGLANVLTILRDGDISVEYMYAYVSKSEENACIILRVSDTERALNILNDHGVSIVDEAY
ncbi:MAG TPA: hypothetical protein H9669_03620 [Firmicutes bacterium]|nr:hypothetical protein [Bacillota bacterium]